MLFGVWAGWVQALGLGVQVDWGLRFGLRLGFRVSRRAQYCLIQEYTLNHIKDP